MKWEYLMEYAPATGEANWLNKMGEEGWELAAVMGGLRWFKRLKETN